MAKEIYLSVDGKQVALTDEQLKALGLYEEPKANPFERVEISKTYYNISTVGDVVSSYESNDYYDNGRYKTANYCTNKELMQQRALHETLNRLLWRFSMENDGGKINWNDTLQAKSLIYFDKERKSFRTHQYHYMYVEGTVFFYSEEIAQRAIYKIVIPFMEEHPDFIW